MALRGLVWRSVYELLAKRASTPDWAFMNYGYVPLPPEQLDPPELSAGEARDRLCIQLYLHALHGADLRNADVLEVGSGRGGGASYISRHLGPRTMTGVDFCQRAVELCTRHRSGPGLVFVQGDALSMPFPDSSFDAVVNIESSHCYESMDRFLAEVARVLRPGGRLFFADLRNTDDVATLHRQLGSSALHLEKATDITANVVAALRLDNDRKLGLIDDLIPRLVHRPFRAFAGIEGTRNFARLDAGASRYLSARLTKPAAPGQV